MLGSQYFDVDRINVACRRILSARVYIFLLRRHLVTVEDWGEGKFSQGAGVKWKKWVKRILFILPIFS